MSIMRTIRMFGPVNDIKTPRNQKDVSNYKIQSNKVLPSATSAVQ